MSTAIIGHNGFVQLSTGKVHDRKLDPEHGEGNQLKKKLMELQSKVGNLNMCIGTLQVRSNVRERYKIAWLLLKSSSPEHLKWKL